MFKSWFGRQKVVEPVPPPAEEDTGYLYDDSVFVTKRLDSGMPVDILGEDATVLCSGRITDENNLRLIIGRLPGAMSLPVVPKDSPITLLAYNKDSERIRITATVIESSITRIVLRNWTLEDDRSKRGAKRLPLEIEGRLFSMQDTSMKKPTKCCVRDLSETGARIISEKKMAEGDAIRLQLEVLPKDGRVSMPSQVVWVKPLNETESEYGLSFAELEKYKVNHLRQSLKDLRTEIVRNTTR